MIEFFLDKNNGIDIVINQNGDYSTFNEEHPIIEEVYNNIKDNYTEAFEILTKLYRGSAYFKYLIVRRFLKCNFSKHDEKPDVNEQGIFDLEFVSCPMRGECPQENIICNAKINRVLSNRELEVLKLIADGNTDFAVGELLFISPNTAKNHRKNIIRKTGCPNTAALIKYASEHNIL